jgi:hypothetical protein
MSTTTSTGSTSTGSSSTGTGTGGAGGAGAQSSSASVQPRCKSGLCDSTNNGALCAVRTPGAAYSSGFVVLPVALVLAAVVWRRPAHRRR